MRIGIVVEYLHARGGTQRQALELARALVALGHDVVVFCRVWNRQMCFPDITRDLEVRAVHEVSTKADDARAGVSRRFRGAARQAVERAGLHDLVALRVMRHAAAELRALITAAAHERRFDVLNAHDFGPAAWAVSDCASTGAATVWQCNDPLYRWGKAGGLLGAPTRRLVVRYDVYRSRSFDITTVLDNSVARVVAARFGTAPIVVRSGVDVDGFAAVPRQCEARQRLGLPEKGFIVLVLTLLNSEHRRAEDGIAIAERLGAEDIVLLAATVTDPGSAYVKRIDTAYRTSLARSRIVWRRGALKGDDELRDLFAAADVFFFPNQQQTWGLAVVEACMAGLPVVVSSGAGSHEVIESGVEGFVYPVADVDGAAEYIKRLRDDVELRVHMGTAARAMARNLSWRHYGEQMLKAFEAACTLRRAP